MICHSLLSLGAILPRRNLFYYTKCAWCNGAMVQKMVQWCLSKSIPDDEWSSSSWFFIVWQWAIWIKKKIVPKNILSPNNVGPPIGPPIVNFSIMRSFETSSLFPFLLRPFLSNHVFSCFFAPFSQGSRKNGRQKTYSNDKKRTQEHNLVPFRRFTTGGEKKRGFFFTRH